MKGNNLNDNISSNRWPDIKCDARVFENLKYNYRLISSVYLWRWKILKSSTFMHIYSVQPFFQEITVVLVAGYYVLCGKLTECWSIRQAAHSDWPGMKWSQP
jgi:hypothetical protein